MISQKPEEECMIEPQQQCKHVTKLVPQLQVTNIQLVKLTI